MFPKILPWLIHQQMQALALPFAVFHVATTTYLQTFREVIR
jgi:hypothetical protein